MPFRDAHALVGGLVRDSLERRVPLAELVEAHPDLGAEGRRCSSPGAPVARRTTPGGAGPEPVAEQLEHFDAGSLSTPSAWAGESRLSPPYRHELRVRYGEVDMQRPRFQRPLPGLRRRRLRHMAAVGARARGRIDASTWCSRGRDIDWTAGPVRRGARHRPGRTALGQQQLRHRLRGVGRGAARVHRGRDLRSVAPGDGTPTRPGGGAVGTGV